MYNINTQYMNECFKRATNEKKHSIHCNNHSEVLDYLVATYNMDPKSSHVVTTRGSVFEVKLSADLGQPTTYVTLIAI